jgi:hypothetical protein
VNLRSVVASGIVAALVSSSLPAAAEEPIASPWRPGAGRVDVLHPTLRATELATPLSFGRPAPEEIRLSHGAKTAIIVTAIVVGALVIVGVVALSSPGHAPHP